MSDRKYRQYGYQDTREARQAPAGPRRSEPRDPREPRDPKAPNFPAFKQVSRCVRCGQLGSTDVSLTSVCGKCGVPLHSCIQCGAFDAGARFECAEPVPARVSPKDTANTCGLFALRVSVERETGSVRASGTSSAKKAFDDLFKF